MTDGNRDDDREIDRSAHFETKEEALERTVVRNIPWWVISVAFHVILLAVLALYYVKKDREETVVLTQVAAERPPPPETVEPPPEEIDRNAIPDDPEQIEEEEVQIDEQLTVTVDEVEMGREDLTNQATDPFAVDEQPGFGFTGGTSIGVGVGGHVSEGVSAYAGRLGPGGGAGKGKYGMRAAKGGGRPTQRVVSGALEWLMRHQDPKGFWSAQGFSAQCKETRCTGDGDAMHDVGVTGLALLAFLGAGSTMDEGEYKHVVKRGVMWLHGIQNETTGSFGEPNSAQGFIYDQALASLAMCEAYGLSNNPVLKKSAQRAVYFVQSARNPYKAWRYAVPPNGENDTSVSGWMVMVLKSAKDFGLQVDEQALEGALLFFDEMTDPNTGRCGYTSRGGMCAREPGRNERWPAEKVEPITAVGMVCRIFMGEDPATSPTLRNGADLLRKSLPLWDDKEGTIDFYYWYYGSYAMFQMGGNDWDTWEKRMLQAIVKTQVQEGCEKGSWDPQFDPWGHRGGRVYSTAIMCLCAEVYSRYTRVIGARGAAGANPTPK